MLTQCHCLFPSYPVRRATMPVPFAGAVRVTDDERQRLESLARAHSTPQALAFRCRLILRAAAPDAPPHLRVAADMHCHRQTVSLWRILEEADLKPHRSVYWLNSHAPAFEAKARDIWQLYVNALRFYEAGRLVICTDEKTGMQMLQRKYPTQPAQPGKPEKREQEYLRHGVRVLIASFVVPTGQLVWNLGTTRTSEDFAAHLANVVRQLPAMHRYDWVVDNLKTHWSLDVCRLVAQWCAIPYAPKMLRRGIERRAFLSNPTHQHVFHFTPKHGSWLNQVELWLSVLARRFLKRGDFCSSYDFETRLLDYLDVYNTHHAHPYRWTYTGQPLVRATPFSQTRRQQRQGRAWFSPRPQCFERVFYPPRPYKRAATQLAMNL